MNSPLDRRKSQICLGCLRCCNYVAVRAAFNMDNENAIDFYNVRGAAVYETPTLPLVAFKLTCQHLTPRGCAIYLDRPQACRDYDGRDDPVLDGVCAWNQITEEEEDKDRLLKLSEKVLGSAAPLTTIVDIFH